MAEFFISRGKMRRVEKNEFLEIKAEVEANGLVTWLLDVGEQPKIPSKIGNFSCSCCGCCCDAFRTISEFNMPGLLAPAHFLPEFDHGNCNYCGNCATKCPMGAITVDTRGKTHAHQLKRCIGCGQCVLACDKKRAILMEPAQGYKKPTQYYPVYGYKFFSGLIRNAWRDWREG
jgi:electron transport complex protein RnfB